MYTLLYIEGCAEPPAPTWHGIILYHLILPVEGIEQREAHPHSGSLMLPTLRRALQPASAQEEITGERKRMLRIARHEIFVSTLDHAPLLALRHHLPPQVKPRRLPHDAHIAPMSWGIGQLMAIVALLGIGLVDGLLVSIGCI